MNVLEGFLLVVNVIAFGVSGSHTSFKGGIITWRPGSNANEIDLTYRAYFILRDENCDDNDILSGTLVGRATAVVCLSPASCDVNDIADFEVHCTAYSVSEDWSYGERTITHPVPGLGPYTIGYSRYWEWNTEPTGEVDFSVSVTINLTTREDTGHINSSPDALFTPDMKCVSGCSHTIHLPVSDPDGDVVKCRWGVTTDECGKLCASIPGMTVDQDNCTILVSDIVPPGLYALALVVEDFSPSDVMLPLSSVSFPLLLNMYTDSSYDCNNKPMFVLDTPAEWAVITVYLHNGWHQQISAMSADETARITTFTINSNLGLTRSSLHEVNSAISAVNLTWTPGMDQIGIHVLCFSAKDTEGIQSDLRCIQLDAVIDTTPPQLNFAFQPLYSNKHVNISWTFDEPANVSCEVKMPNMSVAIPVECDISWEGRELVHGQYTIYIIGTDVAGNQAEVVVHSWYNDITPPVLNFTSQPLYSSKQVNISWTFDEPANVSCEVKMPNISVAIPVECDRSWEGRELVHGQFTIYLTATDMLGNQAEVVTHTWYNDITPPVLNFTSQPLYSNQQVNISWTFDEPANVSCEVKMPNMSVAIPVECDRSWERRELVDGQYTIYITATDMLGNQAEVVAHTWYNAPICKIAMRFEDNCLFLRPTKIMHPGDLAVLNRCVWSCLEYGSCCGIHFHPGYGTCVKYGVGDFIQPLPSQYGWIFYS